MDPKQTSKRRRHRRNPDVPHPEAILRQVAQNTIVSRRAALAAGLTDSQLLTQMDSGLLVRQQPGIYRLVEGKFSQIPALRAGLVLTGGSAAGLWSSVDLHGVNGGIKADRAHVLIDWPAHYKERWWLKAHATKRPVLEHEITRRRGIPVTTMPRTIRDFAAVLPNRPWANRQIVKWTEEAVMLRRIKLEGLERIAAEERSRQVKGRLNRLIDIQRGADIPPDFRSKGEAWLRDLVVRRSLPMPLFNVPVPGVTTGAVDAFCPDVPLIIEFDSFQFHRTRTKHDNDRRRLRHGWSQGIPTIQITWTDFTQDLLNLERDLEQFILDPPMRPTRRRPA